VGASPVVLEAFVPDFGNGTVLRVNTVTEEFTSIGVGPLPFGVAVLPDGSRVYVTNQGDNSVSVISVAEGKTLATITVGRFPLGIAVAPDGKRVYVANSRDVTLSVIDTSTNTLLSSIRVGARPRGVAVDPRSSRVYFTSTDDHVGMVDLSTGHVTSRQGAGVDPYGLVVSPDGGRLYVAMEGENLLAVLDAVSLVPVDKFKVGARPSGVAVSRDGKYVFVTNRNDGTLSIVDVRSGSVTSIPVGAAPVGVSVSADGRRVFVANSQGASLSEVDTATYGVRGIPLPGSYPIAFGNFLLPGPLIITVQVDVKPGGNPNVINPKSRGTTPVAILGSTDYDVTQVNVSTVRLAGAPVATKPNGAYMESFDDTNGDGLIDLVLHFETARLQLTPGDTAVTLEGEMNDGTAFSGTDAVKVVP
jgi:YVTN family beta-propeller protein